MGRGTQLKLLLWKNFRIKRRQRLRLLVEIVLPLCLFLILLLVRTLNQQLLTKEHECHFDGKAMPSAGPLPFFQSLFCTSNNTCYAERRDGERMGLLPSFNNSLISELYGDIERFLTNRMAVDSLTHVLQDLQLLQELTQLAADGLLDDCRIELGSIVMDPDDLRERIAAQNINLNPELVTRLLNASLNATELLIFLQDDNLVNRTTALIPGLDLAALNISVGEAALVEQVRSMLCDGSTEDLLLLSDPAAQEELVSALCNLTITQFTELFEDVRADSSISELMRQMSVCSEKHLGRKFNFDETMFNELEAVVRDFQSLESFGPAFAALVQAAGGIQNLTGSVNGTDHAMELLSQLVCGTSEDFVKATQNQGAVAGALNDEKEEVPEYEYDKTATPFCNDVFRMLHNTTGSRILWKQIKPMIRGKILFTPDTPAAWRIVKEANASFEAFAEIKQLAVDWLNTYPNLTQEFENSEGIERLRQELDSLDRLKQRFPDGQPLLPVDIPLFRGYGENLPALDLGTLDTARQWLRDEPEYPGQYTWRTSFNYTTEMFTTLNNYLDCFEFNKFEAYADEEALEKQSLAYIEQGLFWSGLVFDLDKSNTSRLPKHINYKIRMDASRVDTTFRSVVRDRYWTPGPRFRPLPDMKAIVYGFIYIQDMVEHGIVRLQTGLKPEDDVGVYIQQFPYPCYIRDKFIFAISRGLPLFMVLAWIFTVSMNVMSIVYEKEQRLKEVMKIMGLSDGTHWMAWFITCFTVMFLSVVTMLPILKGGGITPHSDPSVILVLLLAFTSATITFCFAVSVFFSRAKLAAAAAGLLYFTFYLPYPMCYSFEEYMTTWQKAIASLSPPVGFAYACSYMARYEEQQEGARWDNVAQSPIPEDGYNMAGCIVMLIIDSIIYMAIALYIEAVFPGQYGVPRKWYYFVTKSYWLGHQYNMDDVRTEPSMELSQAQQASGNFEPDPQGLPLGVSIKTLKKCYRKKDKPAVDGLSLNFYEGQITSFLGHNGAGKTTTMSILCGLFPPTEGTAYVYNQDIRTDMDSIRHNMGLCPQHNVLFDGLTVEEHLWFYARMKGMQNKDTEQEITRMIADVGLTLKRKVLTKNLSGGMQRKLSVAIAFVSGSKVVILDEPTAGVDPCARRSIWELLLKYRKGRTIVLSTHFMDEADVLGDRIAIVSSGRLVTCGSSMFLKDRYGSGYYLTCVKADPVSSLNMNTNANTKTNTPTPYAAAVEDAQDGFVSDKKKWIEGAEDEGMGDSDEASSDRSSQATSSGIDVTDPASISDLVTFLQYYVPETKLVEDVGMEMTYQLPNGPEHMASFERLFRGLDENLERLGVSSYGISDTTLEEVFLKVADSSGQDGEISDENKRSQLEQVTDGGMYARPVTRLSFRSRLGFLGLKKKSQAYETRTLVNPDGSGADADSIVGDLEETDAAVASVNLPGNVTAEEIGDCTGAGSRKVIGAELKWRQFYALIIKRFLFFIRSRKSFLVQIVWPAAFICLAQFAMKIRPDTPHEPPMEVHPYLLLPPNMHDPFLYTFYSNDAPHNPLTQKMESLLSKSPYLGTRCMNEDAHSIRKYPCKDADDYKDETWSEFTGIIDNSTRQCSCETGYQECSADAGRPSPPMLELPTTDRLINMTGQDITFWLLETQKEFIKRRYGGMSFGERGDVLPANESTVEEIFERLLVAINGGKAMENITTVSVPLVLQDLESVLSTAAAKQSAKIWFNNKGYVSNIGYMNQYNNLLLRAHLPQGEDPGQWGMALTNHPMNRTAKQLEQYLVDNAWVNVVMAICVIMAMSVIPASFSQFLVQEREAGAKHLQFVSGVNPAIYWAANFVWDTINYVVACILCIIIFLAFQQKAFISPGNFPCLVALLMLYGWAMTPLMYVGAYFFKVPSSAIVGLSCGNIFLGFIPTIATFILEIMAVQEDDESFAHINNILTKVFLVLPQYCLGRGLIDMATNQIQSDVLAMLGEEKFVSPLTFKLVGRNLLCLTVFGIIYFVIILMLEYRLGAKFFANRKKKPRVQVEDVMDEDQDVKKERQRVMNGNADVDDVLLLKGLTKIYRAGGSSQRHTAVDNLAVGVQRGECFGLLGVNGAGKTSTFKMLTGDTSVSAGDATLDGHSILSDMVRVHQSLGYCPQFDALCPLMTGAEHLAFYARLKGVPENEVKVVTAWGVKKLGLLQHANKMSKDYSGGNKRKLSTAIALVGNPPVIFLDEPTTGMDPGARRFLWTCIMSIVRSGRSVVLTSHSMEECEALCGRIGIMVNGRLQCLGSIQHIKTRFGKGYTLIVRTQLPSHLDAVVDFLNSSYPGAQIKERQNNMVQYQLPAELTLASIFGTMEQRREALSIEDYSVSQTTLDQVFIYFAKHQKGSAEEEEEDATPIDLYVDNRSIGDAGERGGATPYPGSTPLATTQSPNGYGVGEEVGATMFPSASPIADQGAMGHQLNSLRDSTRVLVNAEEAQEEHNEPLHSFC